MKKLERKNIIVIVVVSILTVGTLVALIPVFMYGLSVDALYVGTGFGLTPLSSSSSDSYNTMQFDFTTPSVNVKHVEVGPYEYLFDGGEVKNDGSTAFQLLTQYVDLTIYINITSPNAQFYELTFTLEDIINMLTQDVNVLLGPDEIEIVNGTYTVSVALKLTISIPDYPPSGYEQTFYFGPYVFYVDVIIE